MLNILLTKKHKPGYYRKLPKIAEFLINAVQNYIFFEDY